MGTIALILLGYLVGSLSFAVLVSRAFGLPDPRSYGSHNPGATNVMRSGKKAAAALTLLGDGAKGWVAVAFAQWLAPGWGVTDTGIAAVALATFLGHLFPLYFGFKGGKGVATAAGVLLALHTGLGLTVMATWLTVFVVSRISSLSALVAAVSAPIYAAYFLGARWVPMLAVLALLLVWRHRSNIRNLLQGKEGNFRKS